MNAIEIRKREAKIILLEKQIEEYIEGEKAEEPSEIAHVKKHIEQHKEQIEILNESTVSYLMSNLFIEAKFVEKIVNENVAF